MRHLPGSLRKVFRSPAFGCSEGGTGADADDGTFSQPFAAFEASRLSAIEADDDFGGKGVDESGASQEFKVVKALVRRRVAGLDAGDAIGKQPAASVTIETDAARNAGEPGGHRGIKGVGQDDGEVEAVGGQRAANAPFLGEVARTALSLPGDEFVAEGFAAIQVSHPGHSEQGDARLREALA